MLTKAGDLFRQGDLGAAIEAGNAAVKVNPADTGARLLLAELLLFAGIFERADSVLDAASTIDPASALVVSEFRQLLRGEMARRQLVTDGRLPEFLGEPTTTQSHVLRALVALRADDAATAAEAVQEAELSRPVVGGVRDGTAFSDFRDADDLSIGSFEVLTTTGKYFWIPTERVESIEFHPPKRPRDLFWRRCTMVVREGPDGDVYLPALYPTDAAAGDSLRLGRATEWTEGEPVRGIGQRVYLAGEEGVPVQQLAVLEFS
ncbi:MULTISPECIES: type VI secretion system accessory protein TagJ [unclassified Inquilinus]|uniref:type VI secretion system accessory protein TagJ n=1 Tax=unclassified Inquilinus TaxID=2645927 RepID=UPI003F93E25E